MSAEKIEILYHRPNRTPLPPPPPLRTFEEFRHALNDRVFIAIHTQYVLLSAKEDDSTNCPLGCITEKNYPNAFEAGHAWRIPKEAARAFNVGFDEPLGNELSEIEKSAIDAFPKYYELGKLYAKRFP